MTDQKRVSGRLIGCAVLDAAGRPLGNLVALYADSDTHEAVFGAVSMRRRGRRRRVFLPVEGARVDAREITVRCGVDLVRDAPASPAGTELPPDDEPDLYAHYDMAYRPATSAARRLVPLTD